MSARMQQTNDKWGEVSLSAATAGYMIVFKITTCTSALQCALLHSDYYMVLEHALIFTHFFQMRYCEIDPTCI